MVWTGVGGGRCVVWSPYIYVYSSEPSHDGYAEIAVCVLSNRSRYPQHGVSTVRNRHLEVIVCPLFSVFTLSEEIVTNSIESDPFFFFFCWLSSQQNCQHEDNNVYHRPTEPVESTDLPIWLNRIASNALLILGVQAVMGPDAKKKKFN